MCTRFLATYFNSTMVNGDIGTDKENYTNYEHNFDSEWININSRTVIRRHINFTSRKKMLLF